MDDQTKGNWYQQSPESYTFLVAGEAFLNRRPVTISSYFGQEAYEALQVYIYIKELLRVIQEENHIDWISHWEYLYIALSCFGGQRILRSVPVRA